MIEVEQHYQYPTAAKLLNVSVSTLRRWIAAGIRTQGRNGIFPVREPHRGMRLVPASAINRFLSRSTPTLDKHRRTA